MVPHRILIVKINKTNELLCSVRVYVATGILFYFIFVFFSDSLLPPAPPLRKTHLPGLA